jgi:hypothetical protein
MMENKEVKKTVVGEYFLMMWEEQLGQICAVMIIIIAALQTVK